MKSLIGKNEFFVIQIFENFYAELPSAEVLMLDADRVKLLAELNLQECLMESHWELKNFQVVS